MNNVVSMDLILAEQEIELLISEFEEIDGLFDPTLLIQKLENLLVAIRASKNSNMDLTSSFHKAIDEIEELLCEKLIASQLLNQP